MQHGALLMTLVKIQNLPPGAVSTVSNGELYIVETVRGEKLRIMEGPNKGLVISTKYTRLVPKEQPKPPKHGQPRIVKIRKVQALAKGR